MNCLGSILKELCKNKQWISLNRVKKITIVRYKLILNAGVFKHYGSFHVKSTTYGRHVTDFYEILHTTWDMKKIPEPKDERSETSEAGVLALEIFPS